MEILGNIRELWNLVKNIGLNMDVLWSFPRVAHAVTHSDD